jgi:hypothetical protein
MEAFKASQRQAERNAKEISRIVVSAAKSFELTARNAAADRRDIMTSYRCLCITSTIKHLAIKCYNNNTKPKLYNSKWLGIFTNCYLRLCINAI